MTGQLEPATADRPEAEWWPVFLAWLTTPPAPGEPRWWDLRQRRPVDRRQDAGLPPR